MWSRAVGAGAVAFVVMMTSRSGLAACSSDKECPGEQICESKECVAPPAPQPAAALPAAPAPPASSAPKGKRHSPSMMAAGIVLTSLAPVGLIVTSFGFLTCVSVDGSAGSGRQTCHSELMLGGLVFTAAAVAVGVPLIVVGARREPVATALIAPWLTPRSSGLRLVLEL